jgi:hypothetical protein
MLFHKYCQYEVLLQYEKNMRKIFMEIDDYINVKEN